MTTDDVVSQAKNAEHTARLRRFKPYPAYKDSGIEWLGEIPSHWDVAPVYSRYEIALGKMLDAKRVTGEFSGRYLRNVDVQWDRVDTEELPEMDFAPSERQRYLLRPGDLLVCEGGEVGRTAVWRGALAECFYQKALHRVRPRSEQESPRLFSYLMYSLAKRGVFVAGGNPNTIDHLTGVQLRHYRVPFAPSPEQRAIAAFLDRETARIDALVAKKERLIELLHEQRTALITRAVTKGLDPSVPMKDSGVEWLGEIPVHWELVPSTWLFNESKQRALEADEQLSATQRYGVIPQAEFERLEGRQVVHAFMHLEQRKHVEADDFVMSMRSFEGGLERVRVRGCVRSSYGVLRASGNVHIGFFAHLFKSSAYIQALRATSNFIRDGQDLNFNNFRLVKLPSVSTREQACIAAFLDREMARADSLIAKVRDAVERLKELRTSLISAAVTGKIDVREAAAGSAGVAETGGLGG